MRSLIEMSGFFTVVVMIFQNRKILIIVVLSLSSLLLPFIIVKTIPK